MEQIIRERKFIGIKIFGIIMLILSLTCLWIGKDSYKGLKEVIDSLFSRGEVHIIRGGDEVDASKIYFFCVLLTGFVYLISSINILRLKNWSRILAIAFSILIFLSGMILSLIRIIPVLSIKECDWSLLYAIYDIVFYIAPFILFSLIFIIFFSRPKVKEQFRK